MSQCSINAYLKVLVNSWNPSSSISSVVISIIGESFSRLKRKNNVFLDISEIKKIKINGTKYSRMDQLEFVEDSLNPF